MSSDEYLKDVTTGNIKELNEISPNKYIGAELFQKEREKIGKTLNWNFISIDLVGSTSISELCVEPILDILLIVKNSEDESMYVPALERVGYVLETREPAWHEYRMLKKCSPKVNLHVLSSDCAEPVVMIALKQWIEEHYK